MELDEGGTKLSTSHSSEGETFSQEEALSISSEEEDALKGHKRSEGTKNDEKLTPPKDELDGDSSLYSVSDLEEDNNSDISFTDVPSLITMDEEPNTTTNVSISQLVSQTSPEHSKVVSQIPKSPSTQWHSRSWLKDLTSRRSLFETLETWTFLLQCTTELHISFNQLLYHYIVQRCLHGNP